MDVRGLSDADKIDKIKDQLKTVYEHQENLPTIEGETLKHYQDRVLKSKVHFLALMAAKYLDHLEGIDPIDDRDDWANKRVEGPGRKMESLTRSAWNKILKNLVYN